MPEWEQKRHKQRFHPSLSIEESWYRHYTWAHMFHTKWIAIGPNTKFAKLIPLPELSQKIQFNLHTCICVSYSHLSRFGDGGLKISSLGDDNGELSFGLKQSKAVSA